MPTVNLVLLGRSVSGGHAIEVDFQLDDGSQSTLQIPFPQIQTLLHTIWEAAAAAETTQRQAAGDQRRVVLAPYRATDIRLGSSPDGTILADFATARGPMQIAMAPNLVRLAIERLSDALAKSAMQRFPRHS